MRKAGNLYAYMFNAQRRRPQEVLHIRSRRADGLGDEDAGCVSTASGVKWDTPWTWLPSLIKTAQHAAFEGGYLGYMSLRAAPIPKAFVYRGRCMPTMLGTTLQQRMGQVLLEATLSPRA